MSPNKNYTGAALIALALAGIWGWAWPEYNRISELGVAINERRGLYSSRSAIIQKIQNLNTEYQKRSSDIAKISSVLPSKKSLAEVVSALDRVALQSGVQLLSASAVGKEGGSDDIAYNTLPIVITANGSYTSMANFLRSIERSLRIMDFVSINASSVSPEKPDLLNLSLSGNTYYLK